MKGFLSFLLLMACYLTLGQGSPLIASPYVASMPLDYAKELERMNNRK